MIAPRRPAEVPRAWTVADLLAWTEAHFKKHSIPSPRLDAELLLAHALGCTRLEIYTGWRKVVEPPERLRFRALIERRGKGEPVAYITGAREFHSLRFEVSPAVLIPRPETEHLVDAVLEHLARLAREAPGAPGASGEAAAAGESSDPGSGGAGPASLGPPRETAVLDIGTGSGNIAVAIAVEVPAARIAAVDASSEALEVAGRNAAAHGVAGRIEFLQGDLFEPLRGRDPRPLFDAIASNPPYIPPRDRGTLPADVRDFEPGLALFDCREGPDGDGLGFHRAIARGAPEFLAPGGILAMEVGLGQAPAVQDLLRAAGFSSVRAISDYGGIPRVVLGLAGSPLPGTAGPA